MTLQTFDDGKNIRQVTDWLGHADPAFTLRTYVHLMDDGLGNVDFLDDTIPTLPTWCQHTSPNRAEAAPSPSTRIAPSATIQSAGANLAEKGRSHS